MESERAGRDHLLPSPFPARRSAPKTAERTHSIIRGMRPTQKLPERLDALTEGFNSAGPVAHRGLNRPPADPPVGRARHSFGGGPFARLVMPPLPSEPGLYLWELDGQVVYVGQTRTPLSKRLGSNGYSTIATFNTLARQPGRTNGGQQTNCRVNALANQALAGCHKLTI